MLLALAVDPARGDSVGLRHIAQGVGTIIAPLPQGQNLYLSSAGIVDLTELSEPRLLATIDGGHQRATSGNYVFLADDSSGLIITDITIPNSPRVVGQIRSQSQGFPRSHAMAVEARSNLVFVGAWDPSLYIVDVRDGSNAVEIGSFTIDEREYGVPACCSREVAVDGNRLYLGHDKGLYILDITDPAAPALLGMLPANGPSYYSGFWGICIVSNLAFVADVNRGLRILDISDASNIAQVGIFPTSRPVTSVDLRGHLAFIGLWGAGIQVLDVSDPAHPASLGGQTEEWAQYVTDVRAFSHFVSGSGNIFELFTGQDRKVPLDFDGDQRSDIAVYWPQGGNWYVLQSQQGFALHNWGWNEAVPVAADYDFDRKTDLAVQHSKTGQWYLRYSRSGLLHLKALGGISQQPFAEDFDGDGKADLAAESYSSPAGSYQSSLYNRSFDYSFSTQGVPVPGDFDGDGLNDIAHYIIATGTWDIQFRAMGGEHRLIQFGWSAAQPVPADFDGDGATDLAVFHPATGMWYWKESRTGRVWRQQWGWSQVIPVPADYDGDGTADVAVYHPATGNWYIKNSQSGQLRLQQWGWPEALPVWPQYWINRRFTFP